MTTTQPPELITLERLHRAAESLGELVGEVTSWRRPPNSWSGGRSGWVRLEPGDPHLGLKFKGLGLRPFGDRPAEPPSPEVYDRWPGETPDAHFGVAADTEFLLKAGDPAPIGGLTLESAHREYRCADELMALGVPCVSPVAVLRLDGRSLRVNGRWCPLGVSVTGSPLSSDLRCGVVAPGSSIDAAELRRLTHVLGVDDNGLGEVALRLRILGRIYEQFGRSLIAFASAGWYRYSGHAENICIDDDGNAMLVDLDSCRPIDELGPVHAAHEAVRDGMSALYNLSCAFYPMGSRHAVTDDELAANEPFSGFLDGWDPESAGRNHETGAAIANYVIDARRQLAVFDEFLSSQNSAADRLYRFVRHDRDLTFSWLYRLLYRRRVARPQPGGMRSLPDVDDLDARLLRFAGRPRFERMMELESACP